MKIFHGIIEIAGQMGILSGELKRRGHIAVGYNTFHSYLGYRDHLINTNVIEIENTYHHLINFFDLFHFHYASSMIPDFSDLALIKDKGKKMIMHHWGNDVRFHEQARINNPYAYTGDSPPNEVMDRKLSKISQYIDEAIVQDYEVLAYVKPYYKKVHILPIAIDLKRFTPLFPSTMQEKPLIVHAPTNPAFKGTAHIERVIEKLRATHDFEYRRIEKMNHEQAVMLYKEADIIVDQILCGSYGLLNVESMALGKPVVAYIRPDLIPSFPSELPVINANPDTIYEQIKMLLDNPELRYERGVAGRIYAEKYHAIDVIGEKLLAIYSELQR